MKKKSFHVLTLVTLLVVAAAAWAVHRRSAAKAAPEQHGEVLEGLGARLNEVTELQLVHGDETLTIRRDGTDWGVVERNGYHAKYDRVKETLLALADLEVLEPKTSRPERYAELGVGEPGPGSEATRVTVKAGADVVADLIVGERAGVGRSGVYVREPDAVQAFLCEGELEVGTDPSAWIEREILRVDGKEVAGVLVRHPDGEVVRVESSDPSGSKFRVANVPKGRKERYEGVANSIATALVGLSLDDVRPVAEVDFEADPIAIAEYRKKNGEKVVLHLARADEKTWVRITSEYVSAAGPAAGADAAAPEAPAEPSEVTEPTEPQAAATEGAASDDLAGDAAAAEQEEAATVAEELAARQRVAERNERLAPWAFAVPEYKATSIAKRLDELLAEPEALPPTPPPAEGEPGATSSDPGAPATDPASLPEDGGAAAPSDTPVGGGGGDPASEGTEAPDPAPAPESPPADDGSGRAR